MSFLHTQAQPGNCISLKARALLQASQAISLISLPPGWCENAIDEPCAHSCCPGRIAGGLDFRAAMICTASLASLTAAEILLRGPVTVKNYDFDPRNLPVEFHAAIGLAVTSWLQTESVLMAAVSGVLGTDGVVGIAVTEHMPMALRLSVLRSVSKLRLKPAQQASLEEKIGDVENAHRKRNALVHNQWGFDPDRKEYFVIAADAAGESDAELRPKTLAQIQDDAEFIYDSGMGLMTFLIMTDLLPRLHHRLHAET